MRISFHNLPQDHIGLTKQQGLMLRLGELLEAKVLKVGPEHALLNLKGQKIMAEIRANLNVGDLIKVRVTGEMQNKIILKIANEISPRQSSSVDQLLQSIGHKSEPDTRSALAFLLKNQLPVSKETLQALLTDQKNPLGQLLEKLVSLAQGKGGTPQQASPAQQTPSGTFNEVQSQHQIGQGSKSMAENPPTGEAPRQSAEARGQHGHTQTQGNHGQGNQQGLPATGHLPSGESVEIGVQTKQEGTQQAQAGLQQGEVTGQAKEAGQLLNSDKVTVETGAEQTKQGVPSTSSSNISGSPASSLPASDLVQGEQKTQQPSSGHKPLTGLLERLAQQQQGASMDEKLAEKSAGTQSTEQGLLKQGTVQQNGGAPKFNTPLEHQSIHQQLEDLGLALNPGKNPGQLAKQLKLFIQNFGFQPKESEAEENSPLSRKLSSLLNSPLSAEQKQEVSRVLEKLLGMRMRQKEDGTLLHLEIPLHFQQPTTGLLQLRDDGQPLSPTSKDQPLSILFQLETEGLGQLKVMAVLQGQELQCNFAASREEIRLLIRRSLPELKGRFTAMDYQVHQMQVMPWIETEESDEPLTGQVDFRV